MKVTIRNFAGIKNEEIIFDGITLVAGLNNTGKSTIGKILDAIFKSLSNLEGKREEEKLKAIYDSLRRTTDVSFFFSNRASLKAAAKAILAMEETDKTKIIDTFTTFINSDSKDDKSFIDVEKILDIKNIDNQTLNLRIISKVFKKIFNNQINNIYDNSTAEIILTVKNNQTTLKFENNSCIFYESNTNLIHSSNYINNPFIIDKINEFEFERDELLKKICKEEENIVDSILGTAKFETVFALFETVAPYEIVNNNREYYIKRKETSDLIKIPNLSTGIKSFLIIRRLIENGSIKEKDILILDEPEIHLHPKWQIIYAELIVLIQKVFDLTVFITSHSPYFIEAIEIFAKKHNIINTTNFYMTNKVEEEITIDLEESTEKIFELLAKPFQQLEIIEANLNNTDDKSISN